MKFALIDAEKATCPVATACEALGVSRPGYYAWRRRPESKRAREDRRLAVKVRESFELGRTYYGSPRILKDLQAEGEHVSRKRVIRLMQEQGLVARVRRRYRCTTMSDHDQPIAPNILARRFEADAPNQRWVGDTTELRVGGSGRVFLAAVLDLYSRFVVGWALSAVNDRQLVIRALEMALRRRCPEAGLLHHSDQGSPYASEDYQAILEAQGVTCSMSRRGNCYDNAVMESFFSTVKSELADRFENFGVAKMELFDYLEVFYNQRRRHSALDYVSPAEYEKKDREQLAA